jgi:hypothetical protein
MGVCLTLALLVGAPRAHAAGTVSVVGGVSDNYKARYNDDPSQPEHRTWLSMDALQADGATWTPAVPSSDHATSDTLALASSDGRTATLSAAVTRGSLGLTVLRTDRPTADVDHVRWGVLSTVTNPDAIAANSGLVQLTMSVGGAVLATGVVEYRHEPAFDGVASTHIEWNGPRGRWFVGGVALRTDWEPATTTTATPAAPGTTATTGGTAPGGTTAPGNAPPASARPRITKLTMPLRSNTRRVAVRVSGRGVGSKITSVRFRVGAASWTRWMRVSSSYRLTLPARTATWTVSAQLRDARSVTSLPASRRVRCTCG